MLPLDRFPSIRSADRDAVHSNIRARFPGARDFTVHARARRPWSIRINSLDLGRGKIVALETGACSLLNGSDGYLRLMLPLSEGLEVAHGSKRRTVETGKAVFGPLADFYSIYQDDYRGLVLGLPQRLMEETFSEFGGQGDLATRLEQVFANPDPAADAIGRHILALVRTLDETPDDLLSQKRFLAAHEELLILHIARFLAAPVSQTVHPQGSSSVYLARAMDYMRQHMVEEIGPAAVARAAGCSLRNLQLLFQREFDQTITGSLRQLRLQTARERLMKPQEQESITSIAIDCGFSHLSDFARHYRSAFGELPSVTLARVRGVSHT